MMWFKLFDYYVLCEECVVGSDYVWDMFCKGIIKVMVG